MTLNGKMVHPDKRKGTVYLHQSEDSLMHFCWKDRTSGTLEDDLIIFPDDAEFKRVTQCTTGRVYVLKFKSSSRRCFYWMQEPKEDKDEELVRKVNEYLNNPPVPGSGRSGGAGGGGGGSGGLHSELNNIGDDDLQNLLNNMSQNQLVQLLGGIGGMSGVANLSSLLGGVRSAQSGGGGGGGGSSGSSAAAADTATTTTTTATSATSSAPALSTAASSAAAAPAASESTKATPAAATTAAAASTSTPAAAAAVTTAAGGSGSGSTTPGAAIQLSDLQSILSGIKMPASEEAGAAEATKEPSVNVDLSSAITAEVLQPLLSNRELMERVETLLPPATESGSRPDALSMFSTALQSGQLGPLMQQFGMEESVVAAAASGDMGAFVKALQSSKKPGEQSTPKKKEDEDEDMGVD